MRTLLSRVLGLPGLLARPVVLVLATAAGAADPRPPAGFTPLFNGKNLEGWHGMKGDFNPYTLNAMEASKRTEQIAKWTEDAKKHWTVENGELVNDGKGPILTTDKDYGDIELFIDYKTVPKADSGIYLRATPQVQIWDYTKEGGKWNLDADKGSGGLWNNSMGAPAKIRWCWPTSRSASGTPSASFRSASASRSISTTSSSSITPAWKTTGTAAQEAAPAARARSSCKRTAARSAGATSSSARSRRPRPTRSCASTARRASRPSSTARTSPAGPGRSKTTRSRTAPSSASRKRAATSTRRSSTPISSPAWNISLPPGGNNGLAIRYPGKGRTASQVGMCEVQILDDDAPKYAKLDPRTVQRLGLRHGGRRTAATCGRSGEWNFMEVTVRGPTLQVELNGTRILDTDLSKVTEGSRTKARTPARIALVGHFGFCGHNDPVAFRNIEIKRLEK